MKKVFALCVVAAALTACGGGSDGTSGQTAPVAVAAAPVVPAPTPVIPAEPLAAYAGTWVSDCDYHSKEIIVATLQPNGSLSTVSTNDYYDGTGCTGNVVATTSSDVLYSVSYSGAVDANVALATGTAPATIPVSRVAIVFPQRTTTIKGPGVTYDVPNSGSTFKYCVKFSDSSSECGNGIGLEPANTMESGLYIRGNEIFLLSSSNNTYSVSLHYTKK